MCAIPERLSVLWIKGAYREGKLTPEELVRKLIDRNKRYDDYNIWIVEPSWELVEPFLRRIENMERSLPLWGVPFAIKDNIDLAGIPTTAACPDYAYVPQESAAVVSKLIQAGAVPMGKTNLDQFATGLVGTRSPYGECCNAFNPNLISGGSSSGSAVSVALGITAFALGTDTAGSGRVPAMLNNLIGYKPPLGSWSTRGVVPACASLDCVTVFANGMEDVRLVDHVARGFDVSCPWSREIPENSARMPEKILIPKDTPEFFGQYAQEYEKKWKETVDRIRSMGTEVACLDDQMFRDAAKLLYEGAFVAERWEELKDFVEGHPESVFPVTEQILRSGQGEEKTAAALFENLHKIQSYKHRTHMLLEDAVMILPTAGGTFTRDEVRKEPIRTNSMMGLYTNHCNLLDLAAVAIPQDSMDRSRPFGITVFGRYDREDLICGFSQRFLEQETMLLAVCGLHKKGGPLAWQLEELGAVYVESVHTSSEYALYLLHTDPVKPGLMKTRENGNAIQVDLYAVPSGRMGNFMMRVPEPFALGDVTLEDGRVVKGFLCQGYAATDAEDITSAGIFAIF